MEKHSFWHGFFYGVSFGFLGLFFALHLTMNEPEYNFSEFKIGNLKGERLDESVFLKGKPIVVMLWSRKYKHYMRDSKVWNLFWKTHLDDYTFVFLTDMPAKEVKKWELEKDIRFPVFVSLRNFEDYPINEKFSTMFFDKNGVFVYQEHGIKLLEDFEEKLEKFDKKLMD